ncbi:MAG: winged helix-turn-helix domain-containing protein [Lysobacterales bacterium]
MENSVYSFAGFTLDCGRVVLTRDGIELPLRPKSFEVLHYLLRNSRQLVERDELLAAVWPGVVVTDDSLTQCVADIRKVLGDDSKKLLLTVPRRGYRLDTVVKSVHGPHTNDIPAIPENLNWPARPSSWTLLALALLGLALFATWWHAGESPGPESAHRVPVLPLPPASIAVLPFKDMSADGDQEYLADGIAEEILNLLSQVPELTVIARTSSFSFKDQAVDIPTIAQRLNVAYILEGSVRKSGDQIRVTAQLIDGSDSSHVLSQNYDEKLGDLFDVQSKIAKGAAKMLTSRLLGEKEWRPPENFTLSGSINMQAWDLYQQGKFFYGRRLPGDVLRAQNNFEQAIAKDPGFSRAWVSLAATLNLRQNDYMTPDAEKLDQEIALPLIKNALKRTLELDPNNPEALIRTALMGWEAGERDLAYQQINQAMRFGHNNAKVQELLAGIAHFLGDNETAVLLQKRAIILDPISYIGRTTLGQYLYLAGQFEAAMAVFRDAAGLNPETSSSNWEVVNILILSGDDTRARELALTLPKGPDRDQIEAMLDHIAGNNAGVEAALGRLAKGADALTLSRLAKVYAFLGDDDLAFSQLDILERNAWSDKTDSSWWNELLELRVSRFLEPLHSDPRWKAWVTEMDRRRDAEVDRTLGESLRQYAKSENP